MLILSQERIKMLTGEDVAHVPTGADAKWRFFWQYVTFIDLALLTAVVWASSRRKLTTPS